MDPFPLSKKYPSHLPELPKAEKLMLCRVCPVVYVYRGTGGSLHSKGNVINIPQDVQTVANTLSRPPEDLALVVVERPGKTLADHEDFQVRPNVIRRWALLFTRLRMDFG
jgi:hypothetical protein